MENKDRWKAFAEKGEPFRMVKGTERAKEFAKKGRETIKRNKEARESLQATMDMFLRKSIKEGIQIEAEDFLSLAETEGKNISVQQAIVLAQVQKAMLGDIESAKFIRDTLGEKPAEKIETQMTIEDYVKGHKVKF